MKMWQILIPFAVSLTSAASPAWYSESFKSNDSIIISAGTSDVNGTAEDAVDNAKKQIASMISLRVQTLKSIDKTQKSSDTESSYSASFTSKSFSSSDVQLFGAVTDKSELVDGIWYARISVPKASMIKGYREKVLSNAQEINGRYPVQGATSTEDSISRFEEALNSVEKGWQDLLIYRYLASSDQKVDSVSLLWAGIAPQIKSQLSRLSEKKSAESNADIAHQIAGKLPKFTKSWSVYIEPCTYKNWSVASPWGIELADLIGTEYVNLKKAKLVTNPAKADLLITGTLIESNDSSADMSVRAVVHDDSTNSDVRSAFIKHLSKATCNRIGWDNIRPKNGELITKAIADYTTTVLPLDHNLSVEFKTDKGDGVIVYKYGEHPQMYVKVSAPCYLNLFYTFATGENTLLFNNHKVEKENVGKWVQLNPSEAFFEITAPAGAEFLTLQACSEKLPVEFTKEVPYQDGYVIRYVQDKTLVEMRGLAVKKNISYSERRIAWTVVEK